jgi:hypothetical protein
MKRDRSLCIYCGASEDLTVDHVPPKNLFPEPRPSDLITVPACGTCNQSYAQDDEYFRLAMTILGEASSVAAELWREKVVRGTLRRSPRLKKQILSTLSNLELRSPAGLYLGTTDTLRFKAKRIDRVAFRIVTALHWLEYGAIPVPNIHVRVVHAPDPRRPGVLERVTGMLLNGRPWQVIGGGTFRYAFNRVADRPECSVWLLVFYSAAALLVILDTLEEEALNGQER